MFPTFEKIKELADKQGISINKLEERLGYSRNTIYNLKTKKPNAERIAEIADYFNVSTDYLLGRTDTPYIATDSENSLMDTQELNTLVMFRKETDGMSEDEKERFNKALAGMMQTARNLIKDDSLWK
ncbi:helix-turn-helix transcriptional regulator [Streptococcus suis]|uniref:helix-turn-helix domain-containing protein n=1 Tax=Streptococcus suis TaxID=1307 RepID=UPI002A76FC01|nr:helix-turn-helix transcriptional regulator [Streptococcus suis]